MMWKDGSKQNDERMEEEQKMIPMGGMVVVRAPLDIRIIVKNEFFGKNDDLELSIYC